MGISFACFNRRENCYSLAILIARNLASLGLKKHRAILQGRWKSLSASPKPHPSKPPLQHATSENGSCAAVFGMLRSRNCTATSAFLQCGSHLDQKLRWNKQKNCTATLKKLGCRKVALSCRFPSGLVGWIQGKKSIHHHRCIPPFSVCRPTPRSQSKKAMVLQSKKSYGVDHFLGKQPWQPMPP